MSRYLFQILCTDGDELRRRYFVFMYRDS
ncbi:Protein of unknown function [Pyronema omphalodes CBS 100304]|uniref:Uncharacterized protein n=1 Tax=Pyronema omphalodes (strain CBS 100304) TaxID=1076935 RepID=U4KV06_PYROM|nr:Protein of unknown function [Pyronema omphalodes CBS 100304]